MPLRHVMESGIGLPTGRMCRGREQQECTKEAARGEQGRVGMTAVYWLGGLNGRFWQAIGELLAKGGCC